MERTVSDGGVGFARGVGCERLVSYGGVVVARGVANERVGPDGGVFAAHVEEARKRKASDGSVELASVATVGKYPQTGVATRTYRSAGLRRSNPSQRERENERSNKDGENRRSVGRMVKHIEPSLKKYLKMALR
jgi:hypothetical protein